MAKNTGKCPYLKGNWVKEGCGSVKFVGWCIMGSGHHNWSPGQVAWFQVCVQVAVHCSCYLFYCFNVLVL